ncbi:DUF4166 domain-containing protein [Xanthobacter autotrophicus DSM 431]|uniref:DUF4166 domain-containing protein n=1 Tax=Xanthobacter nonsaccharivorans TaxID=3119912 RepID=UPI00372A5466
MIDTVLVVGGYGVFGARISMHLAREPQVDVVVAGRDMDSARAFCAQHGGRPFRLDRDDPDLAGIVRDLRPFLVIDAAGPFQAYGPEPYRLAAAAVRAGAHYLDLPDDPHFTAGIAVLDPQAREAGRVVFSGASSVPALSSAATDELAEGMGDIHLIESVILPGNRAPRGLSVIRAIVGQAGRPLVLWRGGCGVSVPGWSGLRRIALGSVGGRDVGPRWASFNAAPDLALFPRRFRARSVLFRAGLELKLMHGGLLLLSLPVRWGLMRSLAPLARPLKWIAERLEPFGSDTGGMRVRVAGVTGRGEVEVRDWVLIAGAGDGPHIPAVPARVLFRMLREGALAPGARACLAAFPLARAEAIMAGLDIATRRAVAPQRLLFAHALGPDFARLPHPVKDLHTVVDLRRWRGMAEVSNGPGRLARLVRMLMRFPKAGRAVPVEVTMERLGEGEVWTRSFAGRRFRSHLSCRPEGAGGVRERFGPFSFDIGLSVRDGRLLYPVAAGRLFGLPLPRALLPVSTSFEEADDAGRATFDVAIALPLAGAIVRYRGWLRPDDGMDEAAGAGAPAASGLTAGTAPPSAAARQGR